MALSASEKKENKDSQLKINLAGMKLGYLSRIRKILHTLEYRISVIPYWQSGYVWISLLGIIFSATLSYLFLFSRRDELPSTLPFFYDHTELNWLEADKSVIFYTPAIFAVISLVLFYLFPKIFYINKRLTIALVLSLFYSNLISIIAFIELIFMVTN